MSVVTLRFLELFRRRRLLAADHHEDQADGRQTDSGPFQGVGDFAQDGDRQERGCRGTAAEGGVIAAIAGVLYTGMRGAADPTSALTFLLPAIAAAYLGSTSIYPGRFNAPGACIAVFFLSTGIMGLNFLGADTFVQNLFYGGGLVIAVSISQVLRNRQPMD